MMHHTYSAGGIILNNDDEILLINEGDGFWGFPKGRLEPNEDALSAAKREIKEETGLTKLTYIRKLGSYQRHPTIGGKEDHSEMKNITLFLLTTDEELLTKNEEGNKTVWAARKSVARMLSDAKDREFYEGHLGDSRVTLRLAMNADKEFARDVHHQAYHDVVVRQFGKWDEREQDAYFESTWSKGDSEIILWNEKPVGYWSVERTPTEIHLHQFLILPKYQGRKIGSHLLSKLVDLSSEANLPIRLQVFRESDALKLYTRIGFRVVRMANDHIHMEFVPNR